MTDAKLTWSISANNITESSIDGERFITMPQAKFDALAKRIVELESELAGHRLHDLVLLELYKRHRHLDMFLSDDKLPPIGRTGSAVLYELWEFIKQSAGGTVVSEVDK